MDIKEARMKLIHGIRHKRTLEDILISMLQVSVVTLILFIVALVAVEAWVAEDNARVVKLQKHFYDLAMSTDVTPPRAPTVVKPNYGDLSEPRTRVFQDSSAGPRKVK
jgi:hypothetical protein